MKFSQGGLMKIFSIIMLSLSVFACAPKDTLMNAKKNSSDGPSVQTMSTQDSNKLLAVSLDKVVASLSYLRATLDPQFRTDLQLIEEQVNFRDYLRKTQKSQIVISSDKLNSESTTGKNLNKKSSQVSISYIVDQKIHDEAILKKLVLLINRDKTLLNRALNAKSDDFESEIKDGSITIEKELGQENLYLINVVLNEKTNSKKDKKTDLETRLEFLIHWDGQIATLADKISIVALKVQARRTGDTQGLLHLVAKDINLSAVLRKCPELSGDALFISIDKDLNVDLNNADSAKMLGIVSDKSTVTFKTQAQEFVSKYTACEISAIVDLTRFL